MTNLSEGPAAGSAQRTDETGDNGPVTGLVVAHGGVPPFLFLRVLIEDR
ncbi:hypothetical protein ACI2LF_15860 [Kribbella sp. NPDC020789]